MVASGRWPQTPIPEPRSTSGSLRFAPALLLCLPAPAMAAGGATVSVASDDMFRGHSVSQGRPVATVDIAYDDPGGLYLGGAATGVVTRDAGAQLLDAQVYAGFAHAIAHGPTLDGGITNTRYTRWYSGNRTVDYTEVYVGIVTHGISSHIRYSPDYFSTGQATLYGDIDGVLRPAYKWRLSGHIGALIQASGPPPEHGYRERFDWRVDLSREVGRFNLSLGWAGVAPGTDYYANRPRGRSSFLLGATYAF